MAGRTNEPCKLAPRHLVLAYSETLADPNLVHRLLVIIAAAAQVPHPERPRRDNHHLGAIGTVSERVARLVRWVDANSRFGGRYRPRFQRRRHHDLLAAQLLHLSLRQPGEGTLRVLRQIIVVVRRVLAVLNRLPEHSLLVGGRPGRDRRRRRAALEIEISRNRGIKPRRLIPARRSRDLCRRHLEHFLQRQPWLVENFQQGAREHAVAASRTVLRGLSERGRVEDRRFLDHGGLYRQPPRRPAFPIRQRIIPTGIEDQDIERRPGAAHCLQKYVDFDPF